MTLNDTLDALLATDDGNLAPNPQQWTRHLQADDKPFVVVNLLNLNNQEALNRYAAAAVQKVQALGAELIYMGRGIDTLIGDEQDGCDIVSIWRWPSRSAWTTLWTDSEYAEIRPLFNEGVSRYRCLVTQEIQPR